jgi:CRP-like cAMP-binding protein
MPDKLRHLCAANSHNCAVCKTSGDSPWCVLSPQELGTLNQSKLTRSYNIGESLYEAGDRCTSLFCINTGTLLIERAAEGGEARRLRLAERGQILGWADFFRGGAHRNRAVCQTDTTVCAIPAETVRQLIAKQPLLALKFLTQAAQELDESEQASLEQVHYPARRRLAVAIASLRGAHGEGMASGEIVLTLPISRRDLADLIAVRPETLSRVIRDLESDGIASFSGRTVHIPDLDRLLDEIEITETSAA